MKLKDNQYIIERTGPIRTTKKLVTEEQLSEHKEYKEKFESYLKREIVNELLCEYEGGIQTGEMYVLTYEKSVDKTVDPNGYRYEMRIAPITRISEKDLEN